MTNFTNDAQFLMVKFSDLHTRTCELIARRIAQANHNTLYLSSERAEAAYEFTLSRLHEEDPDIFEVDLQETAESVKLL